MPYRIGMSAGDFADELIEILRRDAPGRECFTEDDIRAAVVELLEESEEEDCYVGCGA